MSTSEALAAPSAAQDDPSRLRRALGFIQARARPYGLALAYVTASTLAAETLYRLFGMTRLSPVFLAAVLVSAVTLGARPAFFAAALAFSVYNFYLVDPRFTFSLDSPEEVLTLAVFLAVALLTGQLAGRVRDAAVRSQARAAGLGALFEAGREMSATDPEPALRAQLAEHLANAAQGEAEVVYGGETWRAGAPGSGAWVERRLGAGPSDLGLARWRARDPSRLADSETGGVLQVLADLGAAAIGRSRLAAEKAEIESLARTEKLRNALLSSVSHDFRTPLTAILTSATSLKDFGDRFDPKVRDDLLSTIQEEAERLNGYVANLLSFTKLESGVLTVERQAISLAEVAGRLTRSWQPRAGGRLFNFEMEPRQLHVLGDAFLLEQALGNVLANALRFSPPGSTVTLRARREGALGRLEFIDEGPGVPEPELEKIFEKFYSRRRPGGPDQGTGLGLSIARGMIEAMDGRIEADRRDDGKRGLVVRVTLPVADGHDG